MRDHWLIVGATSSMARAFVREAAAHGCAITVAGRDTTDLEATAADAKLRGASIARVIGFDATDLESIEQLVAQASIPDTTVNVLLAVGSMPEQDAMRADPKLLRSMVDSTYSGPIVLLEGLAPTFLAQRRGRVVIIGSVAGDRGRLKNYLYGSAKAGLGAYAEGLRARMFRAGATVTLVKPGFVDTAMTWGLPGLFLVASPQDCARAIWKAAAKGSPTLYYPKFWRLIMLIIQHIPAFVMKRLAF